MNHRSGVVDRTPQTIIAAAIEAKAKEMASYKGAAGADVRLLLVADRIHNSGKLMLEDEPVFDFHGFEAERTKPLELRSDSRLSGKKILANLSPQGEDLLLARND